MTTLADEALIAKAVSLLEFRDIMLHSSQFVRPSSAPTGDVQAQQLTKRRVKFVVGDAPATADAPGGRLLQVFVDLGLLVTQTGGDDPKVYFQIEAEFLVEYWMRGEIGYDSLKAFSSFNAVHNVWPFWRQHVFDIVSRARLPRLNVPFFSGRQPADTQGDDVLVLRSRSKPGPKKLKSPKASG